MDATVDSLVGSLLERLAHASPGERVLVGLCGAPGSGKSQLAKHVIEAVNRRSGGGGGGGGEETAIIVGMDGWHLTRAQLAQMDDPQRAKDRRGAPWTFDDEAFARFVKELRKTPAQADAKAASTSKASRTLFAPSFSHAKKDPVPDDIAVRPTHHIVLFEGLYANVSEGAWRRAAELFDERWVLECADDAIHERLVARHVSTGVAADAHEAKWRADNNDIPNGRYLLSHVYEPARRIRSADDSGWRGAG